MTEGTVHEAAPARAHRSDRHLRRAAALATTAALLIAACSDVSGNSAS